MTKDSLLAIARGIVEARSGQITVRNAGPGRRFLIRRPRAAPPAPGRPAGPGSRRSYAITANRFPVHCRLNFPYSGVVFP